MLTISETWCRRGVVDARLVVARYKKDHTDGRKVGGVAIMVSSFSPLPDIIVNDVVVCNIGHPECRLTDTCVYSPQSGICSLIFQQSRSFRLSV